MTSLWVDIFEYEERGRYLWSTHGSGFFPIHRCHQIADDWTFG